MKQTFIICLLALLVSCEKTISVADITEFDVTTTAKSFKVGQEVPFTLSGKGIHTVSFYSGEVLKDYAFREGRVVDVAGKGVTLNFSSSVQQGAQLNQLSVLVSTNFSGNYSSVSAIKSATWTDITPRVKLGTSATFLATTADVSDLVVAGKPLYVAFRYVTKLQATNGIGRRWLIQSLSLSSNDKLDGSINLNFADQAAAAFRMADENASKVPSLSAITSSRITLESNLYDPATPAPDIAGEVWAVSAPIALDKVNLGPDYSTPLKSITGARLLEHKYVYSKAGNYKAVFVASNNSIDGSKAVVKELQLTITP